ncbi:MAG: aspartyl-phosphate phosphatase Spo0E family protein [Peptococcaceae bacterium]|nr:aspartyl-phosphate phosphatase Spo0E family protein [Peptococcaceae bacterium]
MNPGREIVRLERARNRLLSIDPNDKKKLLAASRKVDGLIAEYYRTRRKS